MERSVAIKRLGKLLGKNLGYRVDNKAPSKDERDAAKAALPAASEDRKRLGEQLEARRLAVLAADTEYQRIKTDFMAAKEKANRLFGISQHFKITVGVSNSMFFHVKAQGDSWEDVIEKIQNGK